MTSGMMLWSLLLAIQIFNSYPGTVRWVPFQNSYASEGWFGDSILNMNRSAFFCLNLGCTLLLGTSRHPGLWKEGCD